MPFGRILLLCVLFVLLGRFLSFTAALTTFLDWTVKQAGYVMLAVIPWIYFSSMFKGTRAARQEKSRRIVPAAHSTSTAPALD